MTRTLSMSPSILVELDRVKKLANRNETSQGCGPRVRRARSLQTVGIPGAYPGPPDCGMVACLLIVSGDGGSGTHVGRRPRHHAATAAAHPDRDRAHERARPFGAAQAYRRRGATLHGRRGRYALPA